MAIKWYVGVSEPAINVETPEELYEALDLLHTQVMDNLEGDEELMQILSNAMTYVQAIIDRNQSFS